MSPSGRCGKRTNCLREEIKKYQVAEIKYREALATNVRLEKLLGLKENLAPPTLTALIQGRDPSLWFKTITLNRGSADGVSKGMPVVAVEGVVGHVLDTATHYAKVLQANDPNCAIEVLIQESRVQGILKGDRQRLPAALCPQEQRGQGRRPGGDLRLRAGSFPPGCRSASFPRCQQRRGMFLDIEVNRPSISNSWNM